MLAHLLIDHMLSEDAGLANFAFVGYQPPLTALDPERLVDEEYIPENLTSAIVRESDFDNGSQRARALARGQKLWQNAWAEFKAGI